MFVENCNFFQSFLDQILSLFQLTVPQEAYTSFLILIFFVPLLLNFFGGWEKPGLYFVYFFTLLPYKLAKVVFGPPFGDEGIPGWSFILLVAFFCYVFRNIDKVIPLVFNTRVGQYFAAACLYVEDRLAPLNERLGKYPYVKAVILGFLALGVCIIWALLNYHYLFFFTLTTPYIAYRNFKRHFLLSEEAEICITNKFSKEIENNSFLLDWEHLITLMSSVALAKHQTPISDRLGFKKLKYPHLSKRFGPVNHAVDGVKTAFRFYKENRSTIDANIGAGLIFLCGTGVIAGSNTQEREAVVNQIKDSKIHNSLDAQFKQQNAEEKYQAMRKMNQTSNYSSLLSNPLTKAQKKAEHADAKEAFARALVREQAADLTLDKDVKTIRYSSLYRGTVFNARREPMDVRDNYISAEKFANDMLNDNKFVAEVKDHINVSLGPSEGNRMSEERMQKAVKATRRALENRFDPYVKGDLRRRMLAVGHPPVSEAQTNVLYGQSPLTTDFI